MRHIMAHTQNKWRIQRCWQQAEKKRKQICAFRLTYGQNEFQFIRQNMKLNLTKKL